MLCGVFFALYFREMFSTFILERGRYGERDIEKRGDFDILLGLERREEREYMEEEVRSGAIWWLGSEGKEVH